MDRYPHKCMILEPPADSNNPFSSTSLEYTEVFSGKCRCFNSKQSAFRTTKVMDCDYCVSIPNPRMVEIGENYKVCVKYPDSPSENEWNLIGYVKDFMRFDRNCEVYFQMVKENLVEGDMPE